MGNRKRRTKTTGSMKKPYLIALILSLPLLSTLGQDEKLYPWTDLKGRTLQASFISFDNVAQTVTIKWNGNIFPLPLNTLSVPSQQLAKQLGAPAPKAQTASSPFDEVVAAMPTEALGPEALDIEHDWKSADGRSMQAKFISLVGDQLTVLMNNGANEFTIALSKFSDESQALAKVLQAVAKKYRPAPPKPAAPVKPVKVVPPKVVEADLDKVHTWTSSDGRPLQASFVSADDKGVDLKLRGRSSPMSLPWSKLDPQTIALGKALQKLKKSLVPTILGGGEKVLERYGSGKWKGYNTYLESVAFEGGLHSNGRLAHIWLLDEDGARVQKSPISIDIYGYTKSGGKGWSKRRVKSLATSPPVSQERRTTTVKGEWENGSTFEYSFEFSHAGMSFWGEVKEPKSEEFPSILRIDLKAPSIIDAANATFEQIKEAAGDGALYVDPIAGKTLKFPFNEKWDDIKKGFSKGGKSVDYNPIKYAEFRGSPFGEHKIKVKSASTRSAHLSWSDGYSQVFPVQGAFILLKSMDGHEAGSSKTPGDFKQRLEIKKSERLDLKVIRGAG